jgi:cell division septation protein DedD
MRRVVVAVFVGMLGALVWVPASSSAAVGYVAYVGCSTTAEALPSHFCLIGEEPGAFFESPEEEVEYEVCVTFPGPETLCTEEPQEAEAGELYVNEITTESPGNHLVRWYVEGVEVAAWSFTMELPPEPEIPPVTTPPTTTPPTTTPPTTTPPATTTPTTQPPPTPPPPAPAPKKPAPKKAPGPTKACRKDKWKIKALEGQFNKAKSSAQRSTIQRLLKKARAAGAKAC